MNVRSAKFVKSVVDADEVLENGIPQVAFVGRSNVGKSSVINIIGGRKSLARTSPTPGHTQVINVYLINKDLYLVDLPGYGFAKGSWADRERLRLLIEWYLLGSNIDHKLVVLIVDANVGVTDMDERVLGLLAEADKKVIVLANKIDKIKKSEYAKKLNAVTQKVAPFKVIPFSAEKKIGVSELIREL